MTMAAHPALVLNADFRPMSYFPLSLLSWQDAVHAVFSKRVAVVAEYDMWARSPSTQIRLPSVVAPRKYQRSARRVAFTRFNVFLRDRFTRLRWSDRQPVLKTGGHRKVWRSNRQPSANTGAAVGISPAPFAASMHRYSSGKEAWL